MAQSFNQVLDQGAKVFWLNVRLLSDTTFGDSNSVAGLIDRDVVHDEFGMPSIPGKTLQGLLRDSWLTMHQHFPELQDAAAELFGVSGLANDAGMVYVSDAQLDSTLRRIIIDAVTRQDNPLHPRKILEAFTDIRYQTSIDRRTGVAEEGSLRAERVVLRGTTFHAVLRWLRPYKKTHVQCLALAALGVRHAGSGRNRGRGHIEVTLNDGWETTCALARGAEADV